MPPLQATSKILSPSKLHCRQSDFAPLPLVATCFARTDGLLARKEFHVTFSWALRWWVFACCLDVVVPLAPRMTRRKFVPFAEMNMFMYVYIYMFSPVLVSKGIGFTILSHCFQGAQKQMEG